MIPILYRVYRYSPRATALSVLVSIAAAILVLTGITLLGDSVTTAVILFVIALPFIFEGVTHKLSDKVAEKQAKKNIETKGKYAYMYYREHPEAYDWLVSVNADFAARYTKLADGTVVKK